jgi:hypothetical protein
MRPRAGAHAKFSAGFSAINYRVNFVVERLRIAMRLLAFRALRARVTSSLLAQRRSNQEERACKLDELRSQSTPPHPSPSLREREGSLHAGAGDREGNSRSDRARSPLAASKRASQLATTHPKPGGVGGPEGPKTRSPRTTRPLRSERIRSPHSTSKRAWQITTHSPEAGCCRSDVSREKPEVRDRHEPSEASVSDRRIPHRSEPCRSRPPTRSRVV